MRVFKRVLLTVAASILVASGPLPGTTPGAASAAACSEIVLGAALSLTGKHSTGGVHTRNGYEFAVRQIKDAGGIKVDAKCYHLRVIYHDAESNPAHAVAVTRRMIENDRVRYMLGPYDVSIAGAVAKVATANRVPMVTSHVTSRAPFPEAHGHLFGLRTPSDQDLRLAVDVAAEVAANVGREPSTIRIVLATGADSDAADIRASVVDRASQHGMTIALDEKISDDGAAVSTTFAKVKRANADLLIVSARAKGTIESIRSLHEMQIHIPMVVMTHCREAGIVERYRVAAQNILCAIRPRQSLDQTSGVFSNAVKFDRAFKAQFKNYATRPVPDLVTQAATAVYVYAKAFERAGSRDDEQLREALVTTDIMTIYGRLTFAPGSGNSRPMILHQIQNGKYNIVAPSGSATHNLNWPRAGL